MAGAEEALLGSVLANFSGTDGEHFFGEWDGAKNYYYDQSLILQELDLAVTDR